MSKERKIRQYIENADGAEKERMRAALFGAKEQAQSAPQRKRFAWQKAVAALASVAIIGTAAFFTVERFTRDGAPTVRYCDTKSYALKDSQTTLREKARQGENLLYLDWYDHADYFCMVLLLNESQTPFGYVEEYMDVNTGLRVQLFAVQKGYALKDMEGYIYAETAYRGSVEVRTLDADAYSRAKFSYGNYTYYLFMEIWESGVVAMDIVDQILESNSL